MAYRYKENHMFEPVYADVKNETYYEPVEEPKIETTSAHLRSIKALGEKVRELAARSERSAQTSYFLALRALNFATNAKEVLGK